MELKETYKSGYKSRQLIDKNVERVVFQIGTTLIKAGFSGSCSPAYKIEFDGKKQSEILEECKNKETMNETLYELPIEDNKLEYVHDMLLERLQFIYLNKLLIDPRTRSVVIVDSCNLPNPVKAILIHILLETLNVPSVEFFPEPLMSLLTVGKMEGLVVNIGYLETSVVPVFDGRPMYVYAQYSSIAGKALEEYLGKVLTQYGAYSIVEVGGFNNKLPKSFVTKKLCNHIIHNFIFASPVAPPKGLVTSSESSETDSPLVCKELLSFYSQTLIASELDFAWELENSQAIRIRLPGWVREHILEVVFLGDPEVDKLGVTELVLRSIKAVPVDLRRTMASNLLITGGLADIPNIRPRLLADISSALYEVPGWNTLAESAKLAEESTEDKQTDGTPLLSSGIVFLSSDRAWIGTSLACSAGFNSTKATLDNLCTFSFS